MRQLIKRDTSQSTSAENPHNLWFAKFLFYIFRPAIYKWFISATNKFLPSIHLLLKDAEFDTAVRFFDYCELLSNDSKSEDNRKPIDIWKDFLQYYGIRFRGYYNIRYQSSEHLQAKKELLINLCHIMLILKIDMVYPPKERDFFNKPPKGLLTKEQITTINECSAIITKCSGLDGDEPDVDIEVPAIAELMRRWYDDVNKAKQKKSGIDLAIEQRILIGSLSLNSPIEDEETEDSDNNNPKDPEYIIGENFHVEYNSVLGKITIEISEPKANELQMVSQRSFSEKGQLDSYLAFRIDKCHFSEELPIIEDDRIYVYFNKILRELNVVVTATEDNRVIGVQVHTQIQNKPIIGENGEAENKPVKRIEIKLRLSSKNE